MNMKDEVGLGLAVQWLHRVLISAYEENCPLRPAKKGKNPLRWTRELESLRREVRRRHFKFNFRLGYQVQLPIIDDRQCNTNRSGLLSNQTSQRHLAEKKTIFRKQQVTCLFRSRIWSSKKKLYNSKENLYEENHWSLKHRHYTQIFTVFMQKVIKISHRRFLKGKINLAVGNDLFR